MSKVGFKSDKNDYLIWLIQNANYYTKFLEALSQNHQRLVTYAHVQDDKNAAFARSTPLDMPTDIYTNQDNSAYFLVDHMETMLRLVYGHIEHLRAEEKRVRSLPASEYHRFVPHENVTSKVVEAPAEPGRSYSGEDMLAKAIISLEEAARALRFLRTNGKISI